jgi:hypothetical protein
MAFLLFPPTLAKAKIANDIRSEIVIVSVQVHLRFWKTQTVNWSLKK